MYSICNINSLGIETEFHTQDISLVIWKYKQIKYSKSKVQSFQVKDIH